VDTLSDLAMLRAMHAGDDAAARWLWLAWAPRIRAFALVLGGGAQLADDITQDVFLKILKCPRAQIMQVRDVGPWLLRTARNELFNHARSEGRLRRRQLTAARERAEATDAPTTPVALGEMVLWLNRLSDEHREVLVLRHVAGLTFDQIGVTLDEPRTTGASRYQAALRSLRQLMASDVAAPEPAPSILFEPRSTQPPTRGGLRHA